MIRWRVHSFTHSLNSPPFTPPILALFHAQVLVNLLIGLSAEEMMDTRLVAQRASVRLGVDLTSEKRQSQVELMVNQLLE
jgi:hypothetical protein